MIFHCKAGYPALFLYHENSIQWYFMKNKWTKLTALVIAALWSGPTVQAQAPHPERIYLSGTGIDDTRTWEFFCSGGQNSGKWKKIEVPCNWELQGFGEYTYGRWYTIKGERPSDETGIYRYKFESPATTPGERIKIFFDGVMTDTKVFINGKPAGEMHQGGFYRFSYDITRMAGSCPGSPHATFCSERRSAWKIASGNRNGRGCQRI